MVGTGEMKYKKDQGRYARMTSFWVVLLVMVAGYWQFHYWLDSQAEFMKTLVLPTLGISVSVLICSALSALTALGLHLFFNRKKTADLLIETESELKKCTWPTGQETWNSSLVVLVTVIFFMFFLAGTDYLLQKLFNFIIFV